MSSSATATSACERVKVRETSGWGRGPIEGLNLPDLVTVGRRRRQADADHLHVRRSTSCKPRRGFAEPEGRAALHLTSTHVRDSERHFFQ